MKNRARGEHCATFSFERRLERNLGPYVLGGAPPDPFFAQDQLLVTRALQDKLPRVWDVAQAAPIKTWELPDDVTTFAVDAQQSFILAATRNGNAYTWPLPKTRAELR
jgi:hypothetical protein